MTASTGWDEYLNDVRGFIESGQLYPKEVDDKLAIAEQLREARRAVLKGEENCLDLVFKELDNYLVYWDYTQRVQKMVDRRSRGSYHGSEGIVVRGRIVLW